MADEPDVARAYNMGPAANLNIKTEAAQAAVNQMAAAMKGLEQALSDFGNHAYMLSDKISRHLKVIGDTAAHVTQQLSGMNAAVSAAGSGGGGRGAPPGSVPSPPGSTGGGGSNWVGRAASSANAAIKSVVDKERIPGISLGTFLGTSDNFVADLGMAPFRFLRNRINTNRDTALMASGGLNMQAMQQGVTTASMMGSMSKFPGSILGNPTDLLELFSSTPGLGASYGFGGAGRQGVRAAGFFKSIREMQTMNPMASVGGMVEQLGNYTANTGSQQRAQMYTGGAMGMIAAGGRQKSLSEWAESIMRWFEGLRPGSNRGKGFDYGELMAQYFPGSNIDAWFDMTGVPANMRQYWWTYALAKVSKTPSSKTTGAAMTIGADPNNVAWQRLRAGTELTRTEFSLAGQMAPQYAQREGANRWFNELMGKIQSTIIPGLANSKAASWIQYLPDSIEDLLMTGAERGAAELFGGGDVGDTGGYGDMGGTGTGGLHPDVQKNVRRMMQANPRVRVTSGLRDTGLQQRLKAKGHGRVSGKPSAHTRGLAADLGPRSEYGWIAKNARKFGLASGASHGEPWHVGMKGTVPGVGDVGDVFDDFLGLIKGGIGGGAEGMGTLVSTLLDMVMKPLTNWLGSSKVAANTGTPDDTFNALVGATGQNFTLHGLPSGSFGSGGGGDFASGAGNFGGGSFGGGFAPNGRTWIGTSASGRGEKYNQVASPEIMRDIQSSDPVTRGTAVARALHNAGFTGDALRNFMKISYRESHWTANAWNSGPLDESGGILQANQLPWTKHGKPAPFTQADAFDPQAAAYIAWDQYKNVSPMNGPGGPYTMKPWTINGNPFGGIPSEAAGFTDEVLKRTGLGDIEMMQAGMGMASGGRGGGGNVVFHNQFTLGGGLGGYGGGSNGGIDVRRTVTLIADHLEDEMRRRLVRSA